MSVMVLFLLVFGNKFFEHDDFVGLQRLFFGQMSDERCERAAADSRDFLEKRGGRRFCFDDGFVQSGIVAASGQHAFIDHAVEPRLDGGVADVSGIIFMNDGERRRTELPEEVQKFHFPFAERNKRLFFHGY